MTPHVHPKTVEDLDCSLVALSKRVSAIERSPAPTDTVYAHVERTVHALLDAIAGELPHVDEFTGCDRIKLLAEAVQALSAWKPPTWPAGYSLETSR